MRKAGGCGGEKSKDTAVVNGKMENTTATTTTNPPLNSDSGYFEGEDIDTSTAENAVNNGGVNTAECGGAAVGLQSEPSIEIIFDKNASNNNDGGGGGGTAGGGTAAGKEIANSGWNTYF